MNFKDAYQQEMNDFCSSSSMERRKEFQRQEERMKDRKALRVILIFVIIGLILWWLSTEREESFTKTYNGVIFEVSTSDITSYKMGNDYINNPTLTVKCTAVYPSKLSKTISYINFDIKLTDEKGILYFSSHGTLSSFDSYFFSPLYNTIWIPDEHTIDIDPTGFLYMSKDIKDIILFCEDETIVFIGPANSDEEAEKIYINLLKLNRFN